jgi:hypothetical protein
MPPIDDAPGTRRWRSCFMIERFRHRRVGFRLRLPCLIARINLAPNITAAPAERLQFVGLDAYAEAGGVVGLHLFDQDGGGYVLNETLLDRIVGEKLTSFARDVTGEGWRWVTGLAPPVRVSTMIRGGRVLSAICAQTSEGIWLPHRTGRSSRPLTPSVRSRPIWPCTDNGCRAIERPALLNKRLAPTPTPAVTLPLAPT